MTPALFILRGKQVGLTLEEMDALNWGQVMDIITESGNDSYNYPQQGTAEDYKKLMGL